MTPPHRATSITWTGLPGGSAAWTLARRARATAMLVVVPDDDAASRLAAELAFFAGAQHVRLLPDDGVRPYEGRLAHPARVHARLDALDRLARGVSGAVVASTAALLRRVIDPAALAAATPTWQPGTTADLPAWLGRLGYLAVDRLQDPGTFVRRGEVLDLWVPGGSPARLELFDEEVEAIRRLDPRTLRPRDAVPEVRVLPASEVIFHDEALLRARDVLRERVASEGRGHELRRRVLDDLRAGLRFAGVDDWLPALHPTQRVSAIQAETVVVDGAGVAASLDVAWQRVRAAWEALGDADRPLVPVEDRYSPPGDVLRDLAGALRIEDLAVEGGGRVVVDFGARANTSVPLRVRNAELAPAAKVLAGWLGERWRVGLVVDSRLRAEGVAELLEPHGLKLQEAPGDPERWPPGRLVWTRGDLPRGFHAPEQALAVVTADEIFGDKVRVRDVEGGRAHGDVGRLGEAARDAAVSSFAQLKEGDLVVHRLHGVGRYRGLRRMDVGLGPQDFVTIEYRDGDLLSLPVTRLEGLSRLQASEAAPVKLDKLGGETWAVRKARVKDAVLQLAHEILETQARRRTLRGHAYVGSTQRYRAFEQAFPYEETPDQARAIEDVLEDLARPEPMDRLVVGDVGFGKTEVALRATMRVVEGGRQVLVLCPTTVLAFQHARTFRDRLDPFGVEVVLLSRFTSPAERKRVLAGLRSGALPVVIGTTALLGRTVAFHDLGLVVVDEEHRFGVQQKERLKRLSAEVDTLALSATPIPRTLHHALSGLRPFSLIATPPPDRLPVTTTVASWSLERIREDLLRELQRGGQAFYVHNRVATLPGAVAAVARAVPEARLAVAHGQMADAELEQVLVRFVDREADVLVCTAIIESGTDMPSVNTILVDRPEWFGLAELHQLRGRVGRSHLRAWCTLLVHDADSFDAAPAEVLLPGHTRRRRPQAGSRRRLGVLRDNAALGSGLAVAHADLDLRGAGDLLGSRQHGHIEAVGLETYVELLEEAMAEASGRVARARIEPEVELPAVTALPEAWIPDVEQRLGAYKRFATARSLEEVRRLVRELEEDWGEPPPEALDLGRVAELKVRCRALGLSRLAWLKVRLVLVLHPSSPLTPAALVELAASNPRRVDWSPTSRELSVRFAPKEAEQPVLFAHWALRQVERLIEEGQRP